MSLLAQVLIRLLPILQVLVKQLVLEQVQEKHKRMVQRAQKPKKRLCRGCKCYPFGDELLDYKDFKKNHLDTCEKWLQFDAETKESFDIYKEHVKKKLPYTTLSQ